MTRYLHVLILLVIAGQAFSRESQKTSIHIQHDAGISLITLRDPYLSLLNYSGAGFRYAYQASGYYQPDINRISWFSRINFAVGLTINPASTASISFSGGNYSYGIRYHFPVNDRLMILGGAFLKGDYLLKENSRNINNPYNMDISLDLNAQLSGRYSFQVFKKTMQMYFNVAFPVAGLMFVPQPGLSYYEMYLRENIADAVHFSAWHNKAGLQEYLKLEIPFRHSVWSVGLSNETLKYKFYDQLNQFNEIHFFVGISYDLIHFAGSREAIPATFKGPDL